MADENHNATVTVTGVDNTGPMAASVANNFKNIATSASTINQAMGTPLQQIKYHLEAIGHISEEKIARGVTGAFHKASHAAKEFSIGVAGGLGLAGGIGLEKLGEKAVEFAKVSVEKFAEAEQAITKLKLATGATGHEAEHLEEQFFKLAETTGQNVETLVTAFMKMKTVAGMSLKDATELFPQVARTAFLTRTSIDDVAKAAAFMGTQMKMSTDQIKTTLDGWAGSLQDVGGEFTKMFGEAAPLMERLGMTGAKATQAYQALFHVLQQDFAEGGINQILKQANEPGTRIFAMVQQHIDAIKQGGEGAKGVMDTLLAELERIDAFGKNSNMILNQFFGGNEEAKSAITHYRDRLKEINSEFDKQQHAAGATEKAMKQYADNTQVAINQVGIQLERLMRTLGGSMPGGGFLHALRDELNEITRLIQALDKASINTKEFFGGTLSEKEKERQHAPIQDSTQQDDLLGLGVGKLTGPLRRLLGLDKGGAGGDGHGGGHDAPKDGGHGGEKHSGLNDTDATKQNTTALYKLTSLMERAELNNKGGGFMNAAYGDGFGGGGSGGGGAGRGAGGWGSGGFGSRQYPRIVDPQGGAGHSRGGSNAGAQPMGGGADSGAGGGGMGGAIDRDIGSAGAHRGKGAWWTPEREQHATNYLMQKGGLPEVSARALVARWSAVESTGGGPNAINPSSKAAGIAQWLGGRKHGFKLGDIESQLDKVIREVHGKEPGEGPQSGRAIMGAKNDEEAATAASRYERAEGYNSATGRDNFTGATHSHMRKMARGSNKQPSSVGSNEMEDLAQQHQKLREHMEKPIRMNMIAPDSPPQLAPYRQRTARQQTRWHSEDQLAFHRNSVASDIGIA